MKPFKRIVTVITLSTFISVTAPRPAQAITTGEAFAIGVGAAAVTYFVGRAYENSRSSGSSGESDYSDRGGTYYSGDDGGGDDDGAAEEWENQQSEAQRRAEIQREFNNQMAQNARMVTKLKGTFDERLDQLKTTTTDQYLCMSFCGSYHASTVLAARIVNASGNDIISANANLQKACSGKDETLFDSIGLKTKNYPLLPPQMACIPAHATPSDILKESQASHEIVHAYVYSVEILPDMSTISSEFKNEVTRETAQTVALVDGHTAAEAMAAASALGFDMDVSDLKTDKTLSRPGYIVMTNGETAPDERVVDTIDAVTEPDYGEKTIQESPVSVEVHCKDETHRVRLTIYVYKTAQKQKDPSPDYIAMLTSAAIAPPNSNAVCEAASSVPLTGDSGKADAQVTGSVSSASAPSAGATVAGKGI
jgi:hypothetical protein